MGLKENIELVKARFNAVNAHDWKRFQGLYADSTVWQDAGLDKTIKGSAAVRRRLEAFALGFPDLRWELTRVFGQGEWICAEFTFTGNHRGPLPFPHSESIAATKKSVRIGACGVYRIDGDRIAESHVYFDRSRILAQLGIESPKKRTQNRPAD
jgi:steroid delta-isomerase-like uncharacterized protein